MVADGAVFAPRIVVAVDELKDGPACVVDVIKSTSSRPVDLGFEGAYEAFCPGVVVRVGAGAHALLDAAEGELLSQSRSAVLAAAITVKDEPWVPPSLRFKCLMQSALHKLSAKVIGQVPADDPA